MGVSKLDEPSFLLLDEKLLRFMDQLELLEEKRVALNSLIEQVAHEAKLLQNCQTTILLNVTYLYLTR